MKIDSNFRFPAAQGQGLTFTGEASQICYASLEDCQIEAPARFCSGVKIDAGSIGACSTPSRVFKGMRMGGQTGGDRITVQNLEVLKVIPENNLLLVKGSIPGAKGSYVIIEK